MRRALRLAAAAGLAALAAGLPALTAWLPARAEAKAVASKTVAQPAVSLLSQTPYVDAAGTFQLHLSLSATHPATDLVEVIVFDQVIDRTDFDLAAAGHVNAYSSYHPAVPLSRLPVDPAGGFDVNIPISEQAPTGSLFSEPQIGDSGVYPVQVRLLSATGVSEATPLTTFLIYHSKSSTFPPLSVAVVVPFATAPVAGSSSRTAGPGPSEAGRLNDLATVLNGDAVPASVLADPSTITAIETGALTSALDRSTLAQLSGVPQGGLIDVLSSTYAPVSFGALASSGLAGEMNPQLSAGTTALQSAFGTAPAPGVWVADGPVDASTVSALEARHFDRLILPASDLSSLPSYLSQFTLAQVTRLDETENVLAADSGITAIFNRNEPPVVAGNQILAELALIQTETPSLPRVVAVLPPAGRPLSAALVGTLLAGLAGNPLLKPVTATQAMSDTPATEEDLVRNLALPDPFPTAAENALAGDAASIHRARGQVDAVSSLFASYPTSLAALDDELLSAESTSLNEAQRHTVLGQVQASAGRVLRQISLPGSSSITLTATKGQLPITILSSSPYRPKVRLRLSSQRLIFQRFQPPGGTCQVPTPTKEICTLSLGSQNTTLKVPVETRSAGAFPLEVSLFAPDGLSMGQEQDSVRSTAVSGVGVILIAVAVLSLAIWWGRDLRHGRRPRGMVPAPAAEPESTDAMSPIDGEAGQNEHGWRPSGDRQRL